MPNVTLHGPGDAVPVRPEQPVAAPAVDTPSQRIVKAANALSYVTDAAGRTFGWRKLDALEDFDLSEIAGATNVGNTKWMLYAMMAFAVREMDGEALSRPITRDLLRARIKLLGSDGLDALFNSMVPQMPEETEDGLPAPPVADDRDRAKN